MTTTTQQRARLADHSFAVFLAPLLEGKRIATVGASSGDVARRCRACGASAVVSFGGTGDGIAVRPLTPGQIASARGRVDGIVVADIAGLELSDVLDEARRALGATGWIAVATGSQTYREVVGALAQRFATVRVFGRGSFVAHAYAAVDQVNEDVALDTRLLPDDPAEAEGFVAIGTDDEVAVGGLSLVQLPPDTEQRTEPAATEAVREQAQKLKDVEAASAERWVQIQRLEHELKNLDQEARKARDRAARLAKDLEDERKLRQRTEIESQMSRRGGDLPRIEEEDHARVVARVAELESQLATAASTIETQRMHGEALARELDEAQASEAALRSQPPAEKHGHSDEEFVRFEQELHRRAEELISLRTAVKERDAAVRELTFAVESASAGTVSEQLQEARERLAELSALNIGLAAEAGEIVSHNDALRERLTQIETEYATQLAEAERTGTAEVARINEQLAAANAELAALQAEPSKSAVDPQSEEITQRLAHDVARLGSELSAAASRERESAEQWTEVRIGLEREVSRLAAELSGSRVRETEAVEQLNALKTDLARQMAMMASMEDRLGATGEELLGARAGYSRRVRELEREVDQLVQALEVTSTSSRDDDERMDALLAQADLLAAERNGVHFRLNDAEAALAGASSPRVPAGSALSELRATELAGEQLLADLAETAARLASTEEALIEAKESTRVAHLRVAELEAEASAERAGPPRSEASATPLDVEEMQREVGERELMVRSLVAQLEDRDLRLRAMERRLVEDVERARRTEGEIWEVELRARDQRIAIVTRDLERARTTQRDENGGPGDDAKAVVEREVSALRGQLDQVRSSLSAILVDGRGAVIAHDLVTLLRQIEEPST